MTNAEQDETVGKWYRERQETKRELACLKIKALHTARDLRQIISLLVDGKIDHSLALHAGEDRKVEGHPAEGGGFIVREKHHEERRVSYLSEAELARLITSIRRAEERLIELEEQGEELKG